MVSDAKPKLTNTCKFNKSFDFLAVILVKVSTKNCLSALVILPCVSNGFNLN